MDQSPMQPASYDGDVAAWADEQAALIRAGRFERLDLSISRKRSKAWASANAARSRAALPFF